MYAGDSFDQGGNHRERNQEADGDSEPAQLGTLDQIATAIPNDHRHYPGANQHRKRNDRHLKVLQLVDSNRLMEPLQWGVESARGEQRPDPKTHKRHRTHPGDRPPPATRQMTVGEQQKHKHGKQRQPPPPMPTPMPRPKPRREAFPGWC